MSNNELKFTRLTLEQNDIKIVWEVPYEDVTGEDMMQAINTIMVGMTFHPETVIKSMVSYVQEYSDEYEIYEKASTVEDAEYEEIANDDKENNEEYIKPHFYA